MIVVTGGAGFIGSNVVHALNARGHDDVVVVDDLTDSRKVVNIATARLADYRDKDEFLAGLADPSALSGVSTVIHQGACSSTTETDGRYVMQNNFGYSKRLLEACVRDHVPLIYASSAAVYGAGVRFDEDPGSERPLNVYGYSKALFDRFVTRIRPSLTSQVVGLRYFNVYGPRESHKDAMASMVLQMDGQLRASSSARLFGASEGCAAGGHRRDFVHVDDVVSVILWFLDHPRCSGIFNCGTGASRQFKELAEAVIGFNGHGTIEYVDFPESLRGRYQSCTQADLSKLRAAGYDGAFRPIESGVPGYLEWLRGADGT